MPVLSAHCFTVVRHEPHTPGKKGIWTSSTREVSAASWEFVYVTRQGAQHWGPVSLRSAQHIHTAQTAQTPLARPCQPHARGLHSQRPVRRGSLWKKTHQAATAAIPWCCEAQHEGCRHQHRVLGEPGSQPAKWRQALTKHLKSGEEKLTQVATERWVHRRQSNSLDRPETEHRCSLCNRDCIFHIGLYSNRRRCASQADN